MKVSVVAFAECMTSAVYGVLDAFGIAGRLAGRMGSNVWATHEVQLVTPGGLAVQGFGGFRMEPHASLDDAMDSDVVIVAPIMGDIGKVLARERALVEGLAALGPKASIVASACTGAFFLAEAGLLRGRRITTNPACAAAFRRRYPDVELALDESIVADQNLICAGSTTAFLDLSVHIVDRLGGHELAVATAKALSMDSNPSSQRVYRFFVAPRDHGDAAVLRIQDRLEDGHESQLAIGRLAQAGGMSRRNLNRRFAAATGLSPAEYLRLVRMERAKRMLESEPMSTDQIAHSVGYGEARSFARAFRASVGCSPGEYRRRFRLRAGATTVASPAGPSVLRDHRAP